jgi:hypothetical protein
MFIWENRFISEKTNKVPKQKNVPQEEFCNFGGAIICDDEPVQ